MSRIQRLAVGRGTVHSELDVRNNALNFIRLSLAVAVIVSHSTPLGGFSINFGVGTFRLGSIAVAGFFAISGYLITRSRMGTPFGTYSLKRLTRILPGYWVCLIVTAFLISPVAGFLVGGWQPGDAVEYVFSNADMVKGSYLLGTTLDNVPYPDWWNGSLWTLRYEVLCYFIVGLALTIGFIRRNRFWILLAFLASSATSVALNSFDLMRNVDDILFLLPVFLSGAVLYLYGDVIPFSAWIAALSSLVFVGLSFLDLGQVLGGLPIAYMCIWLGAALRGPFRRINARNDISYGMYLYGAPVQQLLVVVGLANFGHFVYILSSVLATVPFALASWFLVEKPAMGLLGRKRRYKGPLARPSVDPAHGREEDHVSVERS
jgi:peptidoglycan/LPS O-acetylase OafA/YrhL